MARRTLPAARVEPAERATDRYLAFNPRGQVLESEVLHWDNQRQRIHTDEFVKLTEGDQILTGYGLETDPDLTDLTLRERVEGDLPTENPNGEGLSP